MKQLFTFLLILLSAGNSSAYLGVANSTFYEAVPMPTTTLDPIVYTTFPLVYSGPSPNEINLSAKVDSQMVMLNDMLDNLDSLNLVLSKQDRAMTKLEFEAAQSNLRLKKERQLRKMRERDLKRVMVIASIISVLCLFFRLMWIRARKQKNRA